MRTTYCTSGDLPHVISSANALLVWDFSASGLAAAWPQARNLVWVHSASAGVDRLLTPEVVSSEVTLTSSRGVLDDAMAEYVLGLVLAVLKDLPGTVRRQLDRRWEHRPTWRLAGRRALVVGPGSIGVSVARLLDAVGVEVDAAGSHARPARSGEPFGSVHDSSDLARVVGAYDLFVLCAPLTDRTRGLVGETVLHAVRPGTILINVGRGPLVDESALLPALRKGCLAAVALDVVEHEPLPPSSPLWSEPGVLISPHMAGDTVGWREDLLALFVDNLRRFRGGLPLRNVVDKERGYVVVG